MERFLAQKLIDSKLVDIQLTVSYAISHAVIWSACLYALTDTRIIINVQLLLD